MDPLAATAYDIPATLGSFSLLENDGLLTAETNRSIDWPKLVAKLKQRLAETGRGLQVGGLLSTGTGAVAPETAATVPACRQQIDRLHRAQAAGDGAQMLGVAKELVESTVHVVLRERGRLVDKDWTLPRRAKEAEKAMLLHQSQHNVESDTAGHHVGQILRSLHTVADSTVQLRNQLGRGHGSDLRSRARSCQSASPSSSPARRSSTARCCSTPSRILKRRGAPGATCDPGHRLKYRQRALAHARVNHPTDAKCSCTILVDRR